MALQRECEQQGVDREGLVAAWGIESGQLDAEVRRRVLLRGDEATYKSAKEASDGFEHSFLDFDRVRLLSRDVRDATARYVRSAVFDFAGLEPQHRASSRTHRGTSRSGRFSPGTCGASSSARRPT